MKHRKCKWPADAPVVEARHELALLAEDYFMAGRELASKRASAGRLHAFRLLTKHLRYTLEVFRPLYGPAMDGRLAQLRKVQTVLGELNDYAVTRELMRASEDRPHPGTRTLLEYLDEQEERRRKDFAELWKQRFDAPGEFNRWILYLRRYAHDPKSVV
ncbi:MAG: CHAD domain-containing protein [Bryobacteraceae bacterium]|nr:CHAD domain-containing protein [Bryobacteraceae bacterium]